MLETLVITLREGIEAFLIVAVTLAYLKKTGRQHLAYAVYFGAVLAVTGSVTAVVVLRDTIMTPLYEGLLALIAAGMVLWMMVFMRRAAKTMRQDIQKRMDAASMQTGGLGAYVALSLFTLLMVSREGLETAFLMAALMGQVETQGMLLGAGLGVLLAVALAWGWSRFGHRVNLTQFFKVTTLFLALFVVQLFVYAFHEFTEAGVLPLDNAYWHIATEPYGPEGAYGVLFSYAMVLLPLLWIAVSSYKRRFQSTSTQLQH